MAEFRVKDLGLAEEGLKSISWAESRMPVLMEVKRRFERVKPLEGLVVGGCLHVTKETAVLARVLASGGATVALCGSNPLSTQDGVAAALAQEGFHVYAWRGQSEAEYYECIRHVLDWRPGITLDDGGDLTIQLHRMGGEALKTVIGGTEETTTGVLRLRALDRDGALRYPVIAVNEAQSKSLFDNPLGTGQSALDGVIRATNILLAGMNVVVAGYGRVGSGIAERARGMGARVTVVECHPIRALKAAMSGFQVASMAEASAYGDLFITATGDVNVIRKEHFRNMKDGAILANAGHFDVEVSKDGLAELSAEHRRISECVEEYRLRDGRRLYLLADGRLVNLVCGEGHPSDVMDLSFSLQALCVEYLYGNKGRLPVKVLDVPEDIDMEVAGLKLRCMGISLEELTEEQRRYLSSWDLGT
ncbi:MAG: adenosylhomocysteinase [Candidatus Bathyarchaeia archaeon]|nr:adenosylhomocysteinase [Candidatus Bathyarchaeota archaeon]